MSISEDDLRDLILEELRSLGFKWDRDRIVLPSNIGKDTIRRLHEPARRAWILKNGKWLERKLPELMHYFADGAEVNPRSVSPALVEVREPIHQDLFRFAQFLWSIPLSKGYGRRLRFLVVDESNGKLIGILGLQSPPLSFPPRDRLFRYPEGRKTELVNQTMDIQTLGAVPPYNILLGGKLVALAAASNEVREAYRRKYEGVRTRMKQRVLPAHLVALTTTSAFGRSSIYNRLKYKGDVIAEPIGYTVGYGAFHLDGLYPLFRKYLEERGVSTKGGFGVGPRIKWQTMVRALERLGFSAALLRHGVRREAFMFPLIKNLREYMDGYADVPEFRDLPFSALADWWRERWLLPRASRVDTWHGWDRNVIKHILLDDL